MTSAYRATRWVCPAVCWSRASIVTASVSRSDCHRRRCSARSCAFSTATAAEEASAPPASSSSALNGPPRLFTAWNTPMTLPSPRLRMGKVSRERVRKPLRRSLSLLCRGSLYASGMLMTSPVCATVPAMPRPIGRRISSLPIATRDHSSPLSWSTMKIVARSASSICPVVSAMSWRSVSRSVSLIKRRVTSRSRSRRSTDEIGLIAHLSGLDLLQHRPHGFGHTLEQHLVTSLERPVPLVEDLDDADDRAIIGAPHGADERVERAEARAMVDIAVEARIGVGVGHVDGLARGGDVAGQAPAEREPYLDGRALCDLRPELVVLGIDEEDRRALRIRRLAAEIDETAEIRIAVPLHGQVAELHHDEGDLVV